MKRVYTFSIIALCCLIVNAQHIEKGGAGKKTSDKQNYSNSNSAGSYKRGYSTGIGLRGGFEGGLTVKHFIKDDAALEGIFSTGWGYGGYRITGLYEVHKPFSTVVGLAWFYGAGAHFGSYSGSYYGYYGYNGTGYFDKHGNWHNTGYRSHYSVFGLDAILGLEYQFSEIPFTISLDIKPYVDLMGYGDHYIDGGLSVRYYFK